MNGPPIIDPRQTVRLAYELLLGRPPESEEIVELHLELDGGISINALRNRIMQSSEFLGEGRPQGHKSSSSIEAQAGIDGLLAPSVNAADGFFTDRFGVRTRVGYLPQAYSGYSGKVGSADGTYDMPVHEPAEMNALLRAVTQAKDHFTIIELGAGWGPWIVLGGYLARRLGMEITLMGVEGSAEHVAFMTSHMADNGFDPAQHKVIHAVVGSEDGFAYFPKLPDPSGDWGAQASFEGEGRGELEEVTCVSLNSLLSDISKVDLLHCDVQGAEADVFEAAIDTLSAKVKRTCIGTHSRNVEARLLKLMAGGGWLLEHESPCQINQVGSTFNLVADGVQVWRNPAVL